MSEQENIQVVRKGYEAFGRGDIQGLLDQLAEDVDWSTPGTAASPIAGQRRGRKEVAGFFTTLGQKFDIKDFTPEEFLAKGDLVVVLGRDLAGAKGGRLEPFEWVHIFTVRNGKIVKFREHLDTARSEALLKEAAAASAR